MKSQDVTNGIRVCRRRPPTVRTFHLILQVDEALVISRIQAATQSYPPHCFLSSRFVKPSRFYSMAPNRIIIDTDPVRHQAISSTTLFFDKNHANLSGRRRCARHAACTVREAGGVRGSNALGTVRKYRCSKVRFQFFRSFPWLHRLHPLS